MYFIFFFNDTATTEIYTLSLHDALPISALRVKKDSSMRVMANLLKDGAAHAAVSAGNTGRSEEHTSELQSHSDLVCRLLLEKKKQVYDGQDAGQENCLAFQ